MRYTRAKILITILVVSGLSLTCGSGKRAKPTLDAAKAIKVYAGHKAAIANTFQTIYKQHPRFRLPGKEHTSIHVYDFDHTIANTETRIPVRRADGSKGTLDSKCFKVAKGDRADFGVFKAKLLTATEEIPGTIRRMKKVLADPGAYVIVVTARSQSHTFRTAYDYLLKRGIRVHAVVAVHSGVLMKKVWRPIKATGLPFPSGMKKPILIGGLVDLAQSRGARIKTVKYHEDTDKYISGYLQYMPAAYPAVQAAVYDYIRSGTPHKRSYAEKLVGSTGSVPAGVARYDSGDCP